jgi:hypothetical protein
MDELDQVAAQVQRLKTQAELRATNLGHTPGEWREGLMGVDGVVRTNCTLCGATLLIYAAATIPMVGQALRDRCTRGR